MIIINSNNRVAYSAEKLEKITLNGKDALRVTVDESGSSYVLPWEEEFTIVDGVSVPDLSKFYFYEDDKFIEEV